MIGSSRRVPASRKAWRIASPTAARSPALLEASGRYSMRGDGRPRCPRSGSPGVPSASPRARRPSPRPGSPAGSRWPSGPRNRDRPRRRQASARCRRAAGAARRGRARGRTASRPRRRARSAPRPRPAWPASRGRRPAAGPRRLDAVLAPHAVDDDVEVQLAHAADDCLPGLRVLVAAEGRILVDQLGQREVELLLLRLRLGLDRRARSPARRCRCARG